MSTAGKKSCSITPEWHFQIGSKKKKNIWKANSCLAFEYMLSLSFVNLHLDKKWKKNTLIALETVFSVTSHY